VPSKGFTGLDTPAPLSEKPRSVAKPETEGSTVAEIGGRLRGIEERLEGAKGIDNDAVEQEVLVAAGNPEASRAGSVAQEARDGTPGVGRDEAEKSERASESGTRLAALQPGEDFRAPDRGETDREAQIAGVEDPLAKVISAITGSDEQFARALSDPSPFDTIGGTLSPGDLKTNEILEKAAEAGLAQAQTRLAKRYLLGLVDGREPEKLVELLRNAAERGDQEAQLLLGALFADGRVMPQDLVQSHVFFELAAAQGSKEANDILPDIQRQMAPLEIVDSKRLAREYRRLLNAVARPQSRGSQGEGLRDLLLDAAAAGNTSKIAELLSRGADLEGNDAAGRTAMINAAWRGREEVVDLLVELGADFNVTDYEGRTAISWAASNGHVGIVNKLLDAGARPNLSDNEGLTPLMRAAWNGEEDVVRTLIDHGASLSRTDGSGKSALDYAIQGGHREVVRVLRAFGA
jgi:ankyrin repeat protein